MKLKTRIFTETSDIKFGKLNYLKSIHNSHYHAVGILT